MFTFRHRVLVRLSLSALTLTVALTVVAPPAMGQATKAAVHTSAAKSTVAKSSASVAPPWRLAYHDAKVTVTVDTSATRKTADGFFKTHLKWAYSTDQAIEHQRTYRTLVEDRLLDCDYVQTKPINATVYDAKGTVVNSFTTPMSDVQYMSWSRRKAGTTNERALTAVCRLLRPAAKTKTKTKTKTSTHK